MVDIDVQEDLTGLMTRNLGFDGVLFDGIYVVCLNALLKLR